MNQIDSKELQGIIYKYVADHFGESEADDPSWNIKLLAEHIAHELADNTVTLVRHKTDGGAMYLTDDHSFADASIIIRLDGDAELSKCLVEA